jgi:hypothetical protein
VSEKRIAAFNEAIRRQADDHHVPVVKLSDEPVEERFVSDLDGFHPSDAGHRRIADLFLAVILPEVAVRDGDWEIAMSNFENRLIAEPGAASITPRLDLAAADPWRQ